MFKKYFYAFILSVSLMLASFNSVNAGLFKTTYHISHNNELMPVDEPPVGRRPYMAKGLFSYKLYDADGTIVPQINAFTPLHLVKAKLHELQKVHDLVMQNRRGSPRENHTPVWPQKFSHSNGYKVMFFSAKREWADSHYYLENQYHIAVPSKKSDPFLLMQGNTILGRSRSLTDLKVILLHLNLLAEGKNQWVKRSRENHTPVWPQKFLHSNGHKVMFFTAEREWAESPYYLENQYHIAVPSKKSDPFLLMQGNTILGRSRSLTDLKVILLHLNLLAEGKNQWVKR